MQYLKLALLILICLPVLGCVTTQKNADTTSASTEWRIKSLEESSLNSLERQRQMADENAQNLEKLNKRLEAIETQLAALKTGGAASALVPSAETQPLDGDWVTDLKPEDDGWVEGQKPSAKPKVENDEEKPWATVPAPPPVVPEPEVVTRSKAPKPSAKRKAVTAKALYDQGYALYNAGDFDTARATFDEFLAQYPHDALAPNALYWKGETYYSQKNYPQAILAFKEVTSRFPKHDKSASALLKIGMSYDRAGDRDNAVFYLHALVEDFPKEDAARLGRKELARLGG